MMLLDCGMLFEVCAIPPIKDPQAWESDLTCLKKQQHYLLVGWQ